MEIINQREVVGKVFDTRYKALTTMSALLDDKFQINKVQDKWVVSYEKETCIIMDGEFENIKTDVSDDLIEDT